MSGEQPVGIGVIGTGGWARSFWSEARKSPDVKVVACYDRAPERAEEFAQTYGGEAVTSLEALLGYPGVVAVTNYGPNNAHCEPTLAAAAAGKHVYVEKPIANTFQDAAAMMRACDQAGVALMVGHSTRYQGQSRLLKQILERGELGQIVMVEANISHSGGTRLRPEDWRWHWEEAPGGPLIQLSVHAYDTLHYLFGPTRRVMAFSQRDLEASEIEDVFLTLLEFESGLLAYVGTNYLSPPVTFMRVYGREGNMLTERGKVTHFRKAGEWGTEPVELETPQISAPAAEMSEFARAIRTGTKPETDGRVGTLALGVVWAAIQSAQRKCAVEVREAMGEAATLVAEPRA